MHIRTTMQYEPLWRKKTDRKSAARAGRARCCPAVLGCRLVPCFGKSLAIPQKLKHAHHLIQQFYTQGTVQRNENISKQKLLTRTTIHGRPTVGTVQVSVTGDCTKQAGHTGDNIAWPWSKEVLAGATGWVNLGNMLPRERRHRRPHSP